MLLLSFFFGLMFLFSLLFCNIFLFLFLGILIYGKRLKVEAKREERVLAYGILFHILKVVKCLCFLFFSPFLGGCFVEVFVQVKYVMEALGMWLQISTIATRYNLLLVIIIITLLLSYSSVFITCCFLCFGCRIIFCGQCPLFSAWIFLLFTTEFPFLTDFDMLYLS